MEDMWYQIALATVTKVVKPEDIENRSQKQFEYDLLAFGEAGSRTALQRAVWMDQFADEDDYEYRTLRPGTRVVVALPKGEMLAPIIIGCLRSADYTQDPADGMNWTRRFQEIVTNINRFGEWSVTSDDGPNIRIEKQIVHLGDGEKQSVIIDKENKKITIDAGDFDVTVTGNATINVTGAVTLNCESADVIASKNITAKCKDLDVKASGKTKIKASKDVEIDGKKVKMNKGTGKVITTETQPSCYVTGIPFKGSETVKAGQ